jgi:predicted transcriptional regulator
MKHIEDKKVKDLMTYGIISVPDYAKVMDAIKILLGMRVHGVVVVGKKGRAVGVGVE